MWCIGEPTEEYRRRMSELLSLYARPYDPAEPVICMDEKSKQLLRETRSPCRASPACHCGRTTSTSARVPATSSSLSCRAAGSVMYR